VNQLRAEIHEVLGNRNISDEKFQAVVLDEIAALKVRGASIIWLGISMKWAAPRGTSANCCIVCHEQQLGRVFVSKLNLRYACKADMIVCA
jgi:hypothetical protein